MPILIIAGALAIGLLVYYRQGQTSSFVAGQELVAAAETVRLGQLSQWDMYQGDGYSNKEKFMLSACQNFLTKWYGKRVSPANIKEFLLDRVAVWNASGNGILPCIAGLELQSQPRLKNILDAGQSGQLQAIKTAVSKTLYIDPVSLKAFNVYCMSRDRLPKTANAAAGTYGAEWAAYIMLDQSGKPDWTRISNGRSEISPDQFIAKLPQLCAAAYAGGA